MENEWKNLRFHLTEEMNNMMIELLVTEQMMKESKLTKNERKLLENHKAELLEDFRKEFQRNNIEQIKKYNELMNK
ncbi:MAG TPA: hypothetical protein GXZ63_04090 [Mollicutes bacterium]|jgi:hypothetical protein|nr:hypothetical protein [Mollicutes bacterium]